MRNRTSKDQPTPAAAGRRERPPLRLRRYAAPPAREPLAGKGITNLLPRIG